ARQEIPQRRGQTFLPTRSEGEDIGLTFPAHGERKPPTPKSDCLRLRQSAARLDTAAPERQRCSTTESTMNTLETNVLRRSAALETEVQQSPTSWGAIIGGAVAA